MIIGVFGGTSWYLSILKEILTFLYLLRNLFCKLRNHRSHTYKHLLLVLLTLIEIAKNCLICHKNIEKSLFTNWAWAHFGCDIIILTAVNYSSHAVTLTILKKVRHEGRPTMSAAEKNALKISSTVKFYFYKYLNTWQVANSYKNDKCHIYRISVIR